MQLHDTHGRRINYLRLSVTDRCNMRCFYCMPSEGVVKQHHSAVLSYEELLLIAEASVGIGIEKIRKRVENLWCEPELPAFWRD